MSRTNEPRLSLAQRFKRWMTEDEHRLDEEIKRSVTEPSLRAQHEISPELFAEQEAELEQHINQLRQEEHKQYERLHEWSQQQGFKWLNHILPHAFRAGMRGHHPVPVKDGRGAAALWSGG